MDEIRGKRKRGGNANGKNNATTDTVTEARTDMYNEQRSTD